MLGISTEPVVINRPGRNLVVNCVFRLYHRDILTKICHSKTFRELPILFYFIFHLLGSRSDGPFSCSLKECKYVLCKLYLVSMLFVCSLLLFLVLVL